MNALLYRCPRCGALTADWYRRLTGRRAGQRTGYCCPCMRAYSRERYSQRKPRLP